MSGASLECALRAHVAALSACRRCGFSDPAVVPVVSHARAPLVMLVGQAPGKVEIGASRPFAGRAGRTLFRWLARAGLDEAAARDQVYIAAITRCYPGPSPSGRGDRVPSPHEQELCASWLEAELELIKPALLIPVGRLAISRFLGPRPMHELVGRRHERPAADGGELARVIPLPHPSGASSWVNVPRNRALLNRSLALLGHEFRALGLTPALARV